MRALATKGESPQEITAVDRGDCWRLSSGLNLKVFSHLKWTYLPLQCCKGGLSQEAAA